MSSSASEGRVAEPRLPIVDKRNTLIIHPRLGAHLADAVEAEEPGQNTRLKQVYLPLQKTFTKILRPLLNPSTKSPNRRRPTRRATYAYDVTIFIIHPFDEKNQKIATVYVDTGLRTHEHPLVIEGQDVPVHGTIRLPFLEQHMPEVPGKMKDNTDSLPPVVVANGTTVNVVGWLTVNCFAHRDTRSVTLPRGRWEMNLLVVEVDHNFEDVILGTAAIRAWSLLNGGLVRFLSLKMRQPHEAASGILSFPVHPISTC
jgi:hypothetical protein